MSPAVVGPTRVCGGDGPLRGRRDQGRLPAGGATPTPPSPGHPPCRQPHPWEAIPEGAPLQQPPWQWTWLESIVWPSPRLRLTLVSLLLPPSWSAKRSEVPKGPSLMKTSKKWRRYRESWCGQPDARHCHPPRPQPHRSWAAAGGPAWMGLWPWEAGGGAGAGAVRGLAVWPPAPQWL